MAARSLPPPPVLPAPRKITRAEYDRLIEIGFFRPDERAELIYGAILTMTPIGPPHSSVVRRLGKLLDRVMDRAEVSVQQPFLAHDESEPEPDIAILPTGDYTKKHPDRALLIIEVADSSLDFDRDTKGPLYAASNVPEYWLVNIKGRAVEVYSEPHDGRYARMHRVTAQDERLPFAAFPDVAIRVADVFGG